MHTKARNKMQTPHKWQIEDQANTNKSNGIYTHTYRPKKKKSPKNKIIK